MACFRTQAHTTSSLCAWHEVQRMMEGKSKLNITWAKYKNLVVLKDSLQLVYVLQHRNCNYEAEVSNSTWYNLFDSKPFPFVSDCFWFYVMFYAKISTPINAIHSGGGGSLYSHSVSTNAYFSVNFQFYFHKMSSKYIS